MHETKKQLKERVNSIVKKPKVFLTAAIALLLVLTIITGCAFSGAVSRTATGPSDTTQPTTEATAPTTEVPPTTGENADEITFFENLFNQTGNERNPYYFALTNAFSNPAELRLRYFFDGGFGEVSTPTDAEMAVLKQHYADDWIQSAVFYRLPKEKMNAELQSLFGISLENLPDSAFERLVYLESSDCYCFLDTTPFSVAESIQVNQVEHLNDGTIQVEYAGFTPGSHVVALQPNGDGYKILSNTWNAVSDPTLKTFAELLSPGNSERNPYLSALGHTFSNPTEVKLRYFFEGGFEGGRASATDAEKAELKQHYPEAWVDGAAYFKLSKDKMEEEMQAFFGISLADLPDTAFDGLSYLESTNCYYYPATGTLGDQYNVAIVGVENNDDGTISATYTVGFSLDMPTRIVTLRPNGDGYLILSNVQITAQGGDEPTEPAPLADIPVISQAATLPAHPTVEDLLLEPYTGSVQWHDESGNYFPVDIELPLLVPFCDGAKAINEEIRGVFQPKIDQINYNYIHRYGEFEKNISYEAYLNGDVLSIIIASDGNLDYIFYRTYNLDISTGKQLSMYDMIQRFAGVSYPDFLMHATYTVHNYASRVYVPLDDFEHDAIAMRGYELGLNADGKLVLFSSTTGLYMRTIVIPYDGSAHGAAFSGGEKDSYRWLFTRQTDGIYTDAFAALLADSFQLDPESFLQYLSEMDDKTIQDITANIAYDLHPSEVDPLKTVCSKYLTSNATAKAAKALLAALEQKL